MEVINIKSLRASTVPRLSDFFPSRKRVHKRHYAFNNNDAIIMLYHAP